MKILSNSREIEETLIDLLIKCESCSIAVAWASAKNNFFNVMFDNSKKIKKLIVGMHFYQTDPNFLEAFKNEESLKVIKDLSGVFHPKIYFFKRKQGVTLVIGSANLTKAAFSINSECCAVIELNTNAPEALDIEKVLSIYWKEAEKIDQEFIDSYRIQFSKRYFDRSRLSGEYSKKEYEAKKEEIKSPFKSSIFNMAWDKFIKKISNDNYHSIDGRIEILKQAKELFDKKRFTNFNLDERKKISGFFSPNDDIDWGWFGSMRGAGDFKKQIINNNLEFSKALDSIPSTGEVTKAHFEKFCDHFLKAYDRENPLATATRLLAMKRPDYFFCMASKNKDKFCKDFGLKKTTITISNYWDEVVERIIDCTWWNSECPKGEREKELWLGRAAFLDVIYYEP